MGLLLMLIGYGWAAVGAGNLLMANWGGMGQGTAVFAILFNVLLFVLPGLAIGGRGSTMRSSANAARAAQP